MYFHQLFILYIVSSVVALLSVSEIGFVSDDTDSTEYLNGLRSGKFELDEYSKVFEAGLINQSVLELLDKNIPF